MEVRRTPLYNPHVTMKRRHFLLSLCGCLAANLLLRKTGAEPERVLTALRGLFAHPRDARVIGLRYLAVRPGPVDAQTLLQELGRDITALAARNAPELRTAIAARQRRDFACGDTLIVDNWVLSRTEATLCALVVFS